MTQENDMSDHTPDDIDRLERTIHRVFARVSVLESGIAELERRLAEMEHTRTAAAEAAAPAASPSIGLRAGDRRQRGWKRENLTALEASGLRYETANNGETLLFREPGKPRVDFYPSTGRWRVVGVSTPQPARGGGARNFLRWYARQEAA